ncbi:MAG: type II secretion system minor pseudopilin GspJ [Pseudomonadales bacterium]
MSAIRHRAQPISNKGFTLIEVMVAIAVFAVMTAGVYRVLSTMVDSQDRITAHVDALRELQRSLRFIAMDMNQLVMRDVRMPDDKRSPALESDSGDYLLQFTRQGLRNPLLSTRSDLERVAYSLGSAPYDASNRQQKKRGKGKSLLRHTWGAVDRRSSAKENIQVLFDDVDDASLEFMNPKGDWKKEWPEKKSDGKEHARTLPVAIKLTLKTAKYGELEQVFQVGDILKKEKIPVGSVQ